jgi:hypothetical protein
MVDIVEKLRAGVCKPSTGCLPTDCACAWMDTAADEIARLRGVIMGLSIANMELIDNKDDLLDEIFRLRFPELVDD